MGFRIIRDEANRDRVELIDEPHWVIGMSSLSAGIPSELAEGAAMVVAFSIWSTPDRELAYGAVAIAKAHGLNVRIGLLPYNYPEELSTWLPNTDWNEYTITASSNVKEPAQIRIGQNQGNSPLWFELRNGEAKLVRRGAVSDSEIHSFLLHVRAVATDNVSEA